MLCWECHGGVGNGWFPFASHHSPILLPSRTLSCRKSGRTQIKRRTVPRRSPHPPEPRPQTNLVLLPIAPASSWLVRTITLCLGRADFSCTGHAGSLWLGPSLPRRETVWARSSWPGPQTPKHPGCRRDKNTCDCCLPLWEGRGAFAGVLGTACPAGKGPAQVSISGAQTEKTNTKGLFYKALSLGPSCTRTMFK